MSPKRKNAPSLLTKAPTTPSDTIFFYHLNVKPYDVFCQWKPSEITIPTYILLRIVRQATTPVVLASLGEERSEAVTFNCAEQSYMFFKALYFDDAESCKSILASKDPSEQKSIGQRVKGFSDAEWDAVKSQVARTGNWYKFTNPANKHMKRILLETGDRELAEASSRDRIWGIGYKEENAERYRKSWGLNKLGKSLMAVRTRIRELEEGEDEGKGESSIREWDGGVGDEVDEAELRVCSMERTSTTGKDERND